MPVETTNMPSNRMTDRDKAWLAGVIEARARISIDKQGYIRLRISKLEGDILSEFTRITGRRKLTEHDSTVTFSGRYAVKFLIEIFHGGSQHLRFKTSLVIKAWNESKAGAKHPFPVPSPADIWPTKK
jgi:hypothetical protein